ncbi:hypothetical protein HP550_15160 [Cellulomonas humilata]|uniref:Carboxymuconolactone decarboxylase-like domain-containing protein n=1 Tax=Cellulomonas humilata TaxID=144055 RepID=A0A7Y6DZ19_9CELL|nr:hypothetical protein [Cellulomonas humilata]
MDYIERLRRLALNDRHLEDDDPLEAQPQELDVRTLALVRLAALVATGGAQPSYSAEADAAVGAGATAGQIVDVVAGIIPIVGLPCVVAAAPKLALALGFDVIEPSDGAGD